MSAPAKPPIGADAPETTVQSCHVGEIESCSQRQKRRGDPATRRWAGSKRREEWRDVGSIVRRLMTLTVAELAAVLAESSVGAGARRMAPPSLCPDVRP